MVRELCSDEVRFQTLAKLPSAHKELKNILKFQEIQFRFLRFVSIKAWNTGQRSRKGMSNARLQMTKPLTKTSRDRKVYSRPKSIEENIESAIGLGIEAIKARLKQVNPPSEDYLKSESLIYLFREARNRRDDAMMNLLAAALLGRCDHILKAKLPNSIDHFREDVLAEFSVILANDANEELDFYEVRFNLAFRRHRLSCIKKEINQRERFETTAFGTTTNEDQEVVHSNEPQRRPTESEDLSRSELLDQLPPEIQKAVVLREMGYPIESNNPSEKTVATLCGVTERTIHNRIKKAQNILIATSKESAR